MTYPIPKEALDDRLAVVGTAGSGKTYLTLGAAEHLLARKSRIIFVDPLGVAWGLRLCGDGKTASPFQPVIFGGAHGDLPINEHAGALIGEAVATMRESCIIDLSQLGTKASERRFMLAFLTALYRHTNKEPVHLIIDEADMFAPQKLLDKDGDAAKLLGMMETVIRRGRARGFIPWLLTQRPAVISKDVLSQADGVVALKLTAAQDRKAIAGWVESTADTGQWKAIDARLPTFQQGQGVLWIPGRGILREVAFPPKATFDSSRTPKRGEKRQAAELKPIDLGALKNRLAAVETETKANDPAALKKEVARLKAEIAKASQQTSKPGEKTITADQKARERALDAQIKELRKALENAMKFIVEINATNFFEAGGDQIDKAAIEKVIADATNRAAALIETQLQKRNKDVEAIRREGEKIVTRLKTLLEQDVSVRVEVGHNTPFTIKESAASRPAARQPAASTGADGLSTPQRRILSSLSFWASIGHDAPSRPQVAAVAGYTHTSGSFRNTISSLNVAGLIRAPDAGRLALAGTYDAMTAEEANGKLLSILGGPERKIVDALSNGETLSREELGARVGYEPTSGSFRNTISALNVLNVLTKPSAGTVAMTDWAREVLG